MNSTKNKLNILLLFIDLTALFDTIHRSHCTISANFYFYLQYFQQKVFNFNKINRSQIDPKCHDVSHLFPHNNNNYLSWFRSGLTSERTVAQKTIAIADNMEAMA